MSIYFETVLILLVAIYSVIQGLTWKALNWVKRGFVIIAILADLIIAWNVIQNFNRQRILEEI